MTSSPFTPPPARRLAVAGLALALVATLPALAQSAATSAPPSSLAAVGARPSASSEVERRLRAELRATMTELARSGAWTPGDATQPFVIDMPAQRVADLGLVVGRRERARDGLDVLAVTPGGSADRLGFRSGDVLTAVNGRALNGAQSAQDLRDTVDRQPEGEAVAFEVQREGRAQRLSGVLASVYLPAMQLAVGTSVSASTSGCGRLSDFDVAPRQQQLHAAKIILIDGVTPGPSGAKAFRVSAGRHTVKVSEAIEPKYLPFGPKFRDAGLSQERYKTLEVEVPADGTVLIAARLIEAHRNDWRGGAYWEPVAWKTVNESCR